MKRLLAVALLKITDMIPDRLPRSKVAGKIDFVTA